MIDKRQLWHYVNSMMHSMQSGGRVLALAALLVLGLSVAGAWGQTVMEANAGNGGAALDVKPLLVKGKTTLIDFYSPACPPCVRLAPLFEQLAAKRPDLAIKKVNINRPGTQGIDWASPVAQQYKIRHVPYLMVLSPSGKLMGQGKDALPQVQRWLQEAGLLPRP